MRTPLRLSLTLLLAATLAFSQTNSAAGSDAAVAEQTVLRSIAAFSSSPINSIHLVGTARAIAGSTDESGSFDLTLQEGGETIFKLDAGSLSRTETSGG